MSKHGLIYCDNSIYNNNEYETCIQEKLTRKHFSQVTRNAQLL